jgi:DNA repair exonuclease SbcCD nuclease subunit
MKIIHAADLHLDSPLRNLERYESAPVEIVRGATRRALENLVELAIREQVALILISGDLYDSDWRDYNTGLFFHRQMSKLREANIQVVWLAGNHDAANEITKTMRAIEQLPNVHRLADKFPQTLRLSLRGLDVAVHGQGFLNRTVTDNLAANYPIAIPGLFNIGLLHTSLEGKSGHDHYAPCKLSDLLSKNYHYFALGHVHKQEIISREPWIAFAGNIQGRHIGETGAKGCLLLTLDNDQITEVAPIYLDTIRWRRCLVNVTGATDEDAIFEAAITALRSNDNANWEHPEAIRVEIFGECAIHANLHQQPTRWINELRAHAADISNGRIWLEKIYFHTQGTFDIGQNLGMGENSLESFLQSLHPSDPIIKRLEKECVTLAAKLPNELKDSTWLRVSEPQIFATLLDDIKHMITANVSINLSEQKIL